MEVLFRCISIFLQQLEPGKEIVIHFKMYLTNQNRFS